MAFLRRRRVSRFARAGAITLASGAVVAGCYINNEGLSPPLDSFYFPTAMVVSPGRSALYVASSDFDIQYNGGTVLAVDLRRLRPQLASLLTGLRSGAGNSACRGVSVAGAGALGVNQQALLHPGPCSPIPIGGYVSDSAIIGAFASGATLATASSDEAGERSRLFVTVRGDPSVTYFDVPDDRDPAASSPACGGGRCLDCGQTAAEPRCPKPHLIGTDPAQSQRELRLPPEPVGIAASDGGDAIVVAQQTQDAASLLINGAGFTPSLEFVLSGLGTGPVGVASLPTPALVRVARAAGGSIAYSPGFVVTYSGEGRVDLLRADFDAGSSPARPFLTRAGSVAIQTNASGRDSRGVAIDSSRRDACQASCAEGDQVCLAECTAIPSRLYVANRSPASLLIGDIKTSLVRTGGAITGAFDTMSIVDQVALNQGPSNVAVGKIIGTDGELHTRVFVVAFDSRSVFALDPDSGRIDMTIQTGRGPQTLAFDIGDDGDGLHAYLYVGHFTDSYIGAVDLDARHFQTFGSMFATLGTPIAPRDSQ